jgi:hypothetical protein
MPTDLAIHSATQHNQIEDLLDILPIKLPGVIMQNITNMRVSVPSTKTVVTFSGYLIMLIQVQRLNHAKLSGNGKSEITSIRRADKQALHEYKSRMYEFCFQD